MIKDIEGYQSKDGNVVKRFSVVLPEATVIYGKNVNKLYTIEDDQHGYKKVEAPEYNLKIAWPAEITTVIVYMYNDFFNRCGVSLEQKYRMTDDHFYGKMRSYRFVDDSKKTFYTTLRAYMRKGDVPPAIVVYDPQGIKRKLDKVEFENYKLTPGSKVQVSVELSFSINAIPDKCAIYRRLTGVLVNDLADAVVDEEYIKEQTGNRIAKSVDCLMA